MDEIRYFAVNGSLGTGFVPSSFEAALERDPHFIGCDSGSTDSGPFVLGSGEPRWPRETIKREMGTAIVAAVKRGIPFLVGSAGYAGAEVHLKWAREIAEEIAKEEGLHFKLAVIHSEQTKSDLKRRLAEGRIKPLDPAPELTADVIDRSSRIVGVMGADPYIKALEQGAQVILAGRSTDPSIYAAVPVMRGFSTGLAWHAGKILECGTAAVAYRVVPDCMFATIRRDHFVVEPLHPQMYSTPFSVAAHSLYENGDPYRLVEPTGTLDTSAAVYQAESDRAVRVSGSRFIPAAQPTIRLEGAEPAGYQTLIIGSVRDPVIIQQLDSWLESMRASILRRVNTNYGRDMSGEFQLDIRVYGKNGTMGALEPVQEIRSHEVCLIFEVTAPTQAVATSIAKSAAHIALHHPVSQWKGSITGIAFPYNPHTIERGLTYRFNMNHVVEVDDPCELFRTEMIAV